MNQRTAKITDEVCRYCGEGEAKVRRYPTLTQAQAALEEHFKQSSSTL